MKGIFFRSSMGGGSGFETLMIEEKEKEGVGGALVRPKFVPTLHIGLKFGKVPCILVLGMTPLTILFQSTCFTVVTYKRLVTSPNIALFVVFLRALY